MVPADSDKVSRASPYSGYLKEFTTFRLQDYHLVSSNFPEKFNYVVNFWLLYRGPTTPTQKSVWAVSISLATTKEIDFSFCSSSY